MPDDVAPTTTCADGGAARRDLVADLRKEVASLRVEQHRLRSKFHGELAVLAVRIEDNERRTLKRRKAARRWALCVTAVLWFWFTFGAMDDLLGGSVLLPGLLLAGATLAAGLASVLLILHNTADEQDHRDRYHNWFRLTNPGSPANRHGD